jgi:hypothetical protein
MNPILLQLKKYPSSDFYRFVVDGYRHQHEHGWLGYAMRESGSLSGAITALQYAISQRIDDKKVSIELIKMIHRLATRDIVFHDMMRPGCFREKASRFILIADSAPDGYCSREGVKDLINFVHRYRSKGCALFPEWLSSQHQEEIETMYRRHVNASECSDKFTYESLERDECHWIFRPPAHDSIEFAITSMIDQYQRDIDAVYVHEDKLRVIVDFIQELERIHPFYDGNGRTFYILLQRLLIQNEFLPTIMKNPNHIDGCSAEEVMLEIREGILFTQQLIDNPGAKILNYVTTDTSIEKIVTLLFGKKPSFSQLDVVHSNVRCYQNASNQMKEWLESLTDCTHNLISNTMLHRTDYGWFENRRNRVDPWEKTVALENFNI